MRLALRIFLMLASVLLRSNMYGQNTSGWSKWEAIELDSTLHMKLDALDSTDNYWKAERARLDASRLNGPLRHHGLPFGSDTLTSHHFPEKYGFPINYAKGSFNDDTTRAHQAALYAIWKYYLKLHPPEEDPVFDLLWRVRSMNWVTIDPEKSYTYPEMPAVSNGVMCYSIALPKLGRYAVYYASEKGNEWGCHQPYLQRYDSSCCWGRDFACNANGVIILYDPKLEHAYLIHAYYLKEYGELGYRFFYITKRGRIRLFEGGDTDREIWTGRRAGRWYYLSERHQLRIRRTGKIEIRKKIMDY